MVAEILGTVSYRTTIGSRTHQPVGRLCELSYPLSTGEFMADEELRAELERLRAENDQLKNKGVRGLSLKVSEKGGLSLYGVGRFPVTLYKEQWRKVLGMAGEIEEFIKKNESLLKTKE
jgi:hypothetical protein